MANIQLRILILFVILQYIAETSFVIIATSGYFGGGRPQANSWTESLTQSMSAGRFPTLSLDIVAYSFCNFN